MTPCSLWVGCKPNLRRIGAAAAVHVGGGSNLTASLLRRCLRVATRRWIWTSRSTSPPASHCRLCGCAVAPTATPQSAFDSRSQPLIAQVMARVRGYADAAQAPEWFTTAPSLAIPKVRGAGHARSASLPAHALMRTRPTLRRPWRMPGSRPGTSTSTRSTRRSPSWISQTSRYWVSALTGMSAIPTQRILSRQSNNAN